MGGNQELSESSPKEKTPQGWDKFWGKEMAACQKRLRKFLKQGNSVQRRYLAERAGSLDTEIDSPGRWSSMQLNLFYTNITTLQAMLYGATPQIDVSREFQDPDDDIARVAATLYQRILQTDIEASGEDLPTALRAALQDRLLPGLGVLRVRYEMEVETATDLNRETMEPEEVERITSEAAPVDYVHWQDFRWGWARTWAELPWIAFRSYLTKEEAEERFGEGKTAQLEYKLQQPGGSDDRDDTVDSDQKDNVQKAEIWEIWNKEDRTVYWWADSADAILDSTDDPLELEGFWPCARPMLANTTTSLLQPKADYTFAQDLYNEIDELSARISSITRAVKVVGVYDQSAGDSVGRMLKEGAENDLIPVDNWAMFAEKGGLQGTIDWYPVETAVNTLQTLRQVLGETIEMLYQITGMSDIIRGGNTDQYTSDGTNQLKAKFGSIRVQAIQDEFARFASDSEALKAEVISKHFQITSIAKQSNAMFMPRVDLPLVPEALELMKSENVRWRVNIKPESIAMLDYAQLKSDRVEYMTAAGTYLQSAVTMGKEFPESAPLLLEMLKFGLSGFKGSDYMEGMVDAMVEQLNEKARNPQQQQQDPAQAAEAMKLQIEQLKAQSAQQKSQAEMQKMQMKAQYDQQLQLAKVQGEIAKIKADSDADITIENLDHQNELEKIAVDLQSSITEIQAKLAADLKVEEAQSVMAIAEEEVQHRNSLQLVGAQSTAAQKGQNNE